ncbi:MAG: tripartite tricarboxylate transporter substrate binding protein [Betaproteobacteria bacterium]
MCIVFSLRACLRPHLAVALLLACAAVQSPAQPAEWRPSRAIEFVVPAAAGGGPDTLARLIQRIVTEEKLISQPIVVSNKPGGNHTLAWNHLQQSPGDGHVLMMASLGLLASSLSGGNSIDYSEGTLVAQLFSEPIVFVTHAESGIASARDLAQRLRADAGSITFATGGDGAGGANHLALAQAARAAGGDLRRLRVVQYQSSQQATGALLGRHVEVIASPLAPVLQHVQSGSLRILAVSAAARLPAVASAPTWRESGVDAVFSNVRGVIGPRGLNEAQVRYWEQTLANLAASEPWQKSLQSGSRSAAYLDAAAAARTWKALNLELRAVLGELGLLKK